MVLSANELIDLAIMTGALGYIFMDSFRVPSNDPFHYHSKPGFNWDDFKYACLVVAPSIIAHEMAHKFSALAMGLNATFHAAINWLALGVILKMMNFGFIFFVPGYVSISGVGGSYLSYALIAFMGPLMHLIIWQGAKQYLQSHKRISQRKHHFWSLVMQVNKFLFILNMLPIPGFDGFQVYYNLYQFVA